MQDTWISDGRFLTVQCDLISLGTECFTAGSFAIPCTSLDAENCILTWAGSHVGELTYLGHQCIIGAGCNIGASATIGDFTIVASRTQVADYSMVVGENREVQREENKIGETMFRDLKENWAICGSTWWFHGLRVFTMIYLLAIMQFSSWAGTRAMYAIIGEPS